MSDTHAGQAIAEVLTRHFAGLPRPRTWGRPGAWRCPACGSEHVAREERRLTIYPARTVDVVREIRCLDCGESGGQ